VQFYSLFLSESFARARGWEHVKALEIMCLIGCLNVVNCSLRFYTNVVLSSLCAMINVTMSKGFVFFALGDTHVPIDFLF